jgi:hypothetical protein
MNRFRLKVALTAGDRRTLMRGGFAMLLIAGVGKGVPALREWERLQRGAAAEAIARADLTRHAIAVASAQRAQLADAGRRLAALDSTLIRAGTPAEAGSTLASIITAAADSANVKVSSISVRSDSGFAGSYARSAVRVNCIGDVMGLMTFLASLETGDTALSVKELAVVQSEPGAPEGRQESLRFEVLIEALARKVAGSAEPRRDP